MNCKLNANIKPGWKSGENEVLALQLPVQKRKNRPCDIWKENFAVEVRFWIEPNDLQGCEMAKPIKPNRLVI